MRVFALSMALAAVIASGSAVHAATAAAGELMISEFRLRGSGGASDEYVVIYNATNAAHTVLAAAGTGYGLAASDGAVRFSIPNGTVIPPRGHFLGVNSAGYSLAGYPSGDGPTTGDATYILAIPDNAGIALFNNNLGGANFSLANRLDAVGSTAEANTLYKEGTGYPPLTAFNIDFALFRTSLHGPSTPGDPTIDLTDGEVRDTDNNAADFVYVDPSGTNAGAGQLLGAPGPANLDSPISGFHLAPNIGQSSIDPTAGPAVSPNKVRDLTADPGNNSSLGTIDFRRTFVNRTGGNLTRLRFRIIKLTTFPAPSGIADFRPRTSNAVVVNTAVGVKNVSGTTLEQPAAQPNGGGWNSTLSAGTVTSQTPLANGSSINLRFLFGVERIGTFRFAVVVEAIPAASHIWFVTGDTNGNADTEGFSIPQDAFVVTTAIDENDAGATPANPGGTGLSLREAIALGNADSKLSVISFASPLFDSARTITLTFGQLAINKETTITGRGADKLTISGNNQDRIFSIATFDTVAISGMTIRDGKPSGAFPGGGGILIDNGMFSGFVSLTGLTITNNDASSTVNAVGGGICNEGAPVLIDRCAIVNNVTSSRGGGIQNELSGSMLIVNSTIAGNSAGTTGIGGGIRTLAPLTLRSCTIFGNSAQSAGNISRQNGTFNFRNTIIAGGVLIGAGGSSPDLQGTSLFSEDYNLIQDIAGATITGPTTNNITGVNPLLQSFNDNGGPTPTMGLLGGSPARDKGKSFGLTTDQRSALRPVDEPGIANATGGDGTDIGAFEGVVAGAPASIAINDGDNQTAPVGTNVPIAPSVLVKDVFGTVVSGASVTFQVAAGGGSVTGSPALSNVSGIATLGSWKLGSAAGANTLSVTCGAAPPLTLIATGFLLPPVFQSNPFAAPDPVTAGQPVLLTALATSPSNAALTFTWDFSDGTLGAGAAVMHVYKLAGTYNATVTVTDGVTPTTATLAVHVVPAAALVGVGPDNDGDGFSDGLETALLTDPNDPAQTPTGQPATVAAIKPLALKKAGIKLNFKGVGKDSISLSGTVEIPGGFNPSGARVAIDAGGVVKIFVLTAKAAAKNGDDSVKLSLKSKKGVVASQTSKFSASFKNGAFASALASSGFTDANAKKVTMTCVFTLLLHNDILQRPQAMTYTARKGRSGSAASKK